jgi:hypothetical protein
MRSGQYPICGLCDWPLAADADLKDFAGQWFPEPELFQVGVSRAKPTLDVVPSLLFVQDCRGLKGRDFFAIGNVDVVTV